MSATSDSPATRAAHVAAHDPVQRFVADPGQRTVVRVTAALQTSTSMPPHARDASLHQVPPAPPFADVRGDRERRAARAQDPSPTASHASASRLEITTAAPCCARRVAIARPMPRVEPVTIATLPRRSNSSSVVGHTEGSGSPRRSARGRADQRVDRGAEVAEALVVRLAAHVAQVDLLQDHGEAEDVEDDVPVQVAESAPDVRA